MVITSTLPAVLTGPSDRFDWGCAWWDRLFATAAPFAVMTESASTAVSPADATDIAAALAGRRDAFDRLVTRYQDTLARQMWRFTRDRVVLEELVQDVFVEAYMSLARYRGDGPFDHWLRSIAVRVGYRYWKGRARDRRTAEAAVAVASLPSIDQTAGSRSAKEAAEIVEGLLGRLSPRDRLVITLLHLDECSVAEAAKLTGWSQTMVKVQAFRARKKMQRMLQENER
jgi:RNA polymerase sigma-70 factor (ECF subfamily)